MGPIAQGRVFHLDKSSAITTLTVIQGTFSIYNSTAHILIDTGATNSFVSSKFAKNLEIKPETLCQVLVIETPPKGLLESLSFS